MKSFWRGWREGLTITGLYGLAAVFMTYPLIFRLTRGLVSQSPDVWIFVWNNWWLQKAVATGQNPFFTTLLFYPRGVSLAGHPFSFTHSLFSLLFQPFVGPIAAYNLAIWLIFPISGLGMYCLAKHLTGSRPAAWLAGLVYAFAPYHMTQALGHPNLAYVQWIPFAILFLLRAIQSGSARDAVVSVVFFTLTAFSGQHLLVLAFTWTAIFLPLYRWIEKQHWHRSAWPRLGLIALGTLLFAAPLWWPAVSYEVQGQSVLKLAIHDFDYSPTDVMAYFIPPRLHPVYGPSLAEIYRDLDSNRAWIPYLGYSILTLSAVGAVSLRRRSLPWVISGTACIVLALGPHPVVNGVHYEGVPLPFALLENTIPFTFLRSTDRFNIMVSLPLGVLAAYGFAALEQRRLFARQIARATAVTALSSLILFEYLYLPYPMKPLPQHSSFVTRIAQDPPHYGILDLPMGRDKSKVYLYWQTIHQKPILEGHVSRTPPEAYHFIESNALLSALRHPLGMELTEAQQERALKELADQRVRYILVHHPKDAPEVTGKYRTIIGADPVHTDALLEVYAISQ